MGFHKPPFYSVKHLHMHLFILPYKNKIRCYIQEKLFFKHIDDQINQLK